MIGCQHALAPAEFRSHFAREIETSSLFLFRDTAFSEGGSFKVSEIVDRWFAEAIMSGFEEEGRMIGDFKLWLLIDANGLQMPSSFAVKNRMPLQESGNVSESEIN